MNTLRTIGIVLFALGATSIGYSLWVYSQQPEAAGVWFVPGFILLLTSGVLGLLPVIKRWWKS